MSLQSIRVVDVSSFFSSSCGGIKRYYTEKARFLDPQRVECHFVVPGPVTRVTPFGNGWLHELEGPLLAGNDSYRRFALNGGLERKLRDLEPDVVELASHYHLPYMVKRAVASLPIPPALVGFFHSHPRQVVQNVTAMLPWNLGADVLSGVMWRFAAWQHEDYDATLVASGHMQDAAAEHNIHRVHNVGLGVDVDTFAPRRRDSGAALFVTYAGRFTRDKELPLLLNAFASVHARTGARLRLVGEGPLRKKLTMAAQDRPWLSVHEPVTRREEMAELLSQSTAVVVPSHAETFSFVTAEAMACGTPVVGADAGAVKDLVEKSGCGVTFTAANAISLAGALEMLLLHSRADREVMGERGRAYILRHLTWPAVLRRLSYAYHEALVHKGTRRLEPTQPVAGAVA
ncbi:MAG: glycosyltransferase [Deltaproteobacteria bacterium]|nr:glycosyltransferase [Deltaproteobacteria bacterium]